MSMNIICSHSLLDSYYLYVLLALFPVERERADHLGKRQFGGYDSADLVSFLF